MKAEPVKLWLAKVGYERIQEMADPARSVDRARDYWRKSESGNKRDMTYMPYTSYNIGRLRRTV